MPLASSAPAGSISVSGGEPADHISFTSCELQNELSPATSRLPYPPVSPHQLGDLAQGQTVAGNRPSAPRACTQNNRSVCPRIVDSILRSNAIVLSTVWVTSGSGSSWSLALLGPSILAQVMGIALPRRQNLSSFVLKCLKGSGLGRRVNYRTPESFRYF
jgi:hypothetical protein